VSGGGTKQGLEAVFFDLYKVVPLPATRNLDQKPCLSHVGVVIPSKEGFIQNNPLPFDFKLRVV